MKKSVTRGGATFTRKYRAVPAAVAALAIMALQGDLLLAMAAGAQGERDVSNVSSAITLSSPPGVVIAASPNAETTFLASPSIAILPDKTLVASHDWSGPGMGKVTRTSLYSSSNGGETWTHLADVDGQRWSTLFAHRDALYLFGVAKSFGDIVIRRSLDGGKTWTTPRDPKSGLLVTGRFHTAPVPILLHEGRLWRAFEESSDSGSKRSFSAFLISSPEGADLLDAANWTSTNRISFERQWLNILRPEWSEGNAVPGPQEGVLNVLRLNSHPARNDSWALKKGGEGIPRMEVAAALKASDDGFSIVFDPTEGFLHIPGAQSKFTIRRDPTTGHYWAILQKITRLTPSWDWATSPHHQRNVLVLMSSPDLKRWTERYIVLRYGEGRPMTKEDRTGFQYVDWQFDGNDIVAVCRTAWNAQSYHDANTITFHRLKNFRSLTLEDSPPDLRPE